MDLISVIVPVYKVEKYLDRCIKSIVDQAYKNLEIILVDDGSPDNCPAMCDAWEKKDSRIKVIHKRNGGLSDDRNIGLAVAQGEYIAFIDSDDWVDVNYLYYMYRTIQKTGVGIAACDIQIVEEGKTPLHVDISAKYRVCDAKEALSDILVGQGFRAVTWNKLYHRGYLEGEQFRVGKHHEDEFITYRILSKAEKLVYVDFPLYYYFQRSNSIMHTMSIKRLDALDAYLERLAFLKTKFPKLYHRDKITFCNSCTFFYREGLRMNSPDQSDFLAKICNARKQVHFSVAEILQMTGKELIYVFGTGVFLDLFCRILNYKERKTSDE